MKSDYFHIETMISTAHMSGGMLPSEKILKKCAIKFGASWCILVSLAVYFKFCIKINLTC